MTVWLSSRISGYEVNAGIGTFAPDASSFASVGTVDRNLITRTQYNIAAVTGKHTNMKVRATISHKWDEFRANGVYDNLGFAGPWQISARMYIVSSAHFAPGAVPSPGQILAGGTGGQGVVQCYRRTSLDVAYSGTFGLPSWTEAVTWNFDAVTPDNLTPGQKYWIMVMPVRVKLPFPGAPQTTQPTRVFTPPVGQPPNTIGRAISFWTNRPQAAPVITAPISGTIQPPGSNFNLTVTFNDPDETGTPPTPDTTGCNGAQVQYRPRPTTENPSPTWLDMPFYSTNPYYGASPQAGWSILGSLIDQKMSAQLLYSSVAVRVGGDPLISGVPAGYLPAGDWQIRVRSFDPGMPYNWLSSGVRPINGVAGEWHPNNYFSSLISPWSTPVNVTVPDQVPPPIPIRPINNVAVPEGNPITLVWQYRNTGVPPFAQATRHVEYREVGSTDWIVLASGVGSAPSFVIDDGLPAGGHYEWRVSVTDTDNEVSDPSAVGTFWVVPVPQSGGIRPIPEDTIDGGTLGCGKNQAFIYRRGGKIRVAEITEITYLDWGRVRDDISTSKIVVADWTVDCGNLLSKLQTWAYEVVIFRDNGYSNERVWEGPITKLTYEADRVVIDAKDVMVYPYRRIIKQAMNDTQTGGTVTERAVQVLQNVMGPDDPNVLAYLTPILNPDDPRQYRNLPAYSRTAFEEIDDMAANAGLDYTTVGRAILVWSTRHRIGTLQEFKDADFGAPPIVSEYGMSMANVYSVSDGNGIHGDALRLDANNADPIYGLVEMLSSTWASDSQDEHGTLTQEGLQTVIDSFEGFAERSISHRYPPPVIVRVPDNTTLNPDAVVSIQQLVPGVAIPLRASGTLRTVIGTQKLDSVKVIEQADTETISITMSPFNREDSGLEEEAE